MTRALQFDMITCGDHGYDKVGIVTLTQYKESGKIAIKYHLKASFGVNLILIMKETGPNK